MNLPPPTNYTILAIDDTPANLRLLTTFLNRPGFHVLTARNGQSGLQRALYGKPDLILLDVLMPGIDGFETCRQLKANPETAPIPVIFMTALTDKEYIVQGFQAGAIDYITKPIQTDELLARVSNHLHTHSLTQHLEHEISERTAALQQSLAREQQLAAKLKLALAQQQQLDQIKTQVINVVSHEFRTPLNIIAGSITLLREHLAQLSPEHRTTIFTRIDQSILYLTELLNDAFFINTTTKDTITINPTPIQLEPFIRSLSSELQNQYNNHPITLQFTNLDQPIHLDPKLLRQILANLLTNAFKFSPNHQDVYIHATRQDNTITISIRDAGLGIPPADLPHIFDLFHRASNVETIRGLGLGLAIAQQLAQAMQGSIQAKSPGTNRGSTFIVQLAV